MKRFEKQQLDENFYVTPSSVLWYSRHKCKQFFKYATLLGKIDFTILLLWAFHPTVIDVGGIFCSREEFWAGTSKANLTRYWGPKHPEIGNIAFEQPSHPWLLIPLHRTFFPFLEALNES